MSIAEGGLVSAIVPCRNERAHVDAFCRAALAQRLPEGWTLELLIADGDSDDGTSERLRELAAADSRVRVLHNPLRIVSTGLNLALAQSAGAVVVRLDVHTEYAPDYVAECLRALRETGADNVGGPWHAEPDADAGPLQRAAAAAFQSSWVAGGARSRRLDFDGWVDTVYLGCWPRASFERYGTFDETLVRNQDDEHNLRIVRGGGRVWQSSRIRSVYRPRARLGQVARQYLQYGYWRPFVMRKHRQPAALRQLVPGLFVGLLVVTALAASIGVAWPLGALLGAYAIALLVLTAAVLRGSPLTPAAAARVPLVIAAYHLGYGAGSLLGGLDLLLRRGPRARYATLSR